MSSASRYIPHYTVDDYRQWEGDWELWSGVPVAMTPSPFGRHQLVAANLVAELRSGLLRAGCDDCFVLFETDWEVADDTVVRPDVAVLCGPVPERFIDTPPKLIAEVLSDSTRHKDTTAKRALYEQQNVHSYLLIDPSARTVELLELTSDNGYHAVELNDPLSIRIDDGCEIILDLNAIFRPS